MNLFDNDIIVARVIVNCTVDFLWKHYKMFGKSPLCSLLRNGHIVTILSEEWKVKKSIDFLTFMRHFDKKYFISDYTTVKYRRSRLKEGFGINRLLIYSVVNNWEKAINIIASSFSTYTWVSRTLFKYCYRNPGYYCAFGRCNYLESLITSFHKRLSDIELLEVKNELESSLMMYDLDTDTLEVDFNTLATMFHRNELINNSGFNNILAAISVDDPSYFKGNPVRIEDDVVARLCLKCRRILETLDLRDNSRFLSRTIPGIKILVKNNVKVDTDQINYLGYRWLIENGIDLELHPQEVAAIQWGSSMYDISPDDVIKLYDGNTNFVQIINRNVEEIINL